MSGGANSGRFRSVFTFGAKELAHYFPGHMARGIKKMQATLRHIDCVIEVHDARIPFTGRNPIFEQSLALNLIKPHMLVLNKMDLADLSHREKLEQKIRDQGVRKVMYTNCKDKDNLMIRKKIIPEMVKLVEESDRYNRANAEDYNVMIIGVPNVGKSSLINILRSTQINKGRATPVGAVAGITRSVMNKIKVSDRPKVFLLDTPGILNPALDDLETGMKLAACANMKDHLVGEMTIADYILFWLNKHGFFQYVKHFELPGATDNVVALLTHIAKQKGLVEKRRSVSHAGYDLVPHYERAGGLFNRAFREGHLGKVNLDMDMLHSDDLPKQHQRIT